MAGIADALGIGQFAVMGHSGGGTHALASGQDRVAPIAHVQWLARRCPSAELWLRPDDGHISVLNSAAPAMDWLRQHASQD